LIQKNLYPNIDFYSGIALKAVGFPTEMFTALFAIARTAGWIAQWKEMIEGPIQRISRPRQLYTGASDRSYIRSRRADFHFDRGALISIFLFGITGGDVFPGQPIRNVVLD
jgi:hypothetical protein